ncbi:MAG: hypothetical protein ACRD96_29455, partial [Bryobacteraceae bacterium]
MRRLPLLMSSVLVLPFFNLTPHGNLDWIGESLAETVREALAVEGVVTFTRDDRQEVFRRLAVRPYALLTRASVVKLGEAAGATHVVWGQYEVSPEAGGVSPKSTLRIRSRVLDLQKLRQGSELTELGALEDLAPLETHLAWQAVRALASGPAPSEADFRRTRPALRVDAIESYIRGLLADSPDQKLKLFAQAARLDTRYSQPCFQLGRLYAGRLQHRESLPWLERVSRADSHYSEAQFLLGLGRYFTGDFAGAES